MAREAISHRRTLLVVGKCSVDYSGRAKSKLDQGERILIVKPDGSFLVHRSTGYEPVNWMPGGNVVFQVQRTQRELEIRAIRRRPSESVKVLFNDVYLVTALDLLDDAEFKLYASEKDMQKAILLEPDLIEEGFRPLSREKKVDPGFIDVYGADKNGRLVVVEIKREKAGKNAVFQLAKYIEAVKGKADREVRGIIAAPGIAKDVQRVLVTLGLEFRHLDPRKCSETLRIVETKKLGEYFTQS